MKRGGEQKQEKRGFHEVALASLAHAVAGVQEPEEGGGEDGGEPVTWPDDEEHGGGGDEQEKGVKDAPGNGAVAEGVDDGPINHERAREIHVGDLPIGREPVICEEADVVLEGAIIYKGPMAREHKAGSDQGDEPCGECQLRPTQPRGVEFGHGCTSVCGFQVGKVEAILGAL